VSGRQSLAGVFAAPAVIAALSLIGLVGALLGDDVWDWAGCVLAAAPLAATAWALALRRR
jgi:xanthosine utilization system XapX-like protein